MANIEFSKVIKPTTDTTLYGHQAYDQAGFPMNAGNFKLSTIMGMFLSTQDDEIKGHFEFVEGLDRNYTLNYKGVAVASLKLPPDRFLKEARFNQKSKILSLTFATDTTDQVVDIDFSSLIDVYSAGNGLQLSDATFSLKLQSGEARLKLSPSGLYLDLSDITKKIDDEASTRLNADNGLSLRIKTLEDSWTSNLQTIQEASRIATNAATQASADAKTALDGATASTGASERASVHANNADASKKRAMEWAVKLGAPVEGQEFSAKKHAIDASDSASTATAKASEASTSASNAKTSETNAKASETECARLVGTVDTARIQKLEEKLNKEITDRGTAVTNESTARSNADTALGNRITDETNVRISEDRKLQNQINERRLPAGSFIWYTGKTAPTGYLVCNGQAVSRTKYSALFSAIDTIYGAGDGSTTFNLPNMMDGNGRFIRATTNPSNTKQDDAIRPITGEFYVRGSDFNNSYTILYSKGAFSYSKSNKEISDGYKQVTSDTNRDIVYFDANNSDSMKDHANGQDIHPMNIGYLPLIAY